MQITISTRSGDHSVDTDDLRVVDWDGTGLRLYVRRGERERCIAEKRRGRWRDTEGGFLDDETAAVLDDLGVTESRRVRDGSKPMPPGTYWDPDLGHYVEPTDDEWSEQRRDALRRR